MSKAKAEKKAESTSKTKAIDEIVDDEEHRDELKAKLSTMKASFAALGKKYNLTEKEIAKLTM